MPRFWLDSKIRLLFILLAIIGAGVAVLIVWIIQGKNKPAGTSIAFPVINERVVDQYTGRTSSVNTQDLSLGPTSTVATTITPTLPSPTVTPTPTGTPLEPTPTPAPTSTPRPTPTPTKPTVAWPEHKFPRTANYYLIPKIQMSDAKALSKYDILITGAENQYNNSEVLLKIRELNPNILIFAYVNLIEFPVRDIDINEPPGGPYHQMQDGIDDRWWLRDTKGNYIDFWPGSRMINLTASCPTAHNQKWQTYLPDFALQNIIGTGLWDGIFFDEAMESLWWLNDGNIDLNGDHKKESAAEIDRAWQDGTRAILKRFQEKKGKQVLQMTNGGDMYYPYIDGNLFEGFPKTEDSNWDKTRAAYLNDITALGSKGLVVLHAEGHDENDFQTMRYGLATALLGNGYFAMSTGPSGWHDKIWWYNEFDLNFGWPVADAQRLSNGVWQRSYEHGLVLVNPTGQEQGVALNRTMRTVDGDPVTEVHIWSKDGVILKK